MEAQSPDHLRLPMRATVKQLEVNYLGSLEHQKDIWRMPHGRLHATHDELEGTLVHGLPGKLENVLVVYCPGNGQMPRLWRRQKPWPAGEPMSFHDHRDFEALVVPYENQNKRVAKREGYLGRLIAFKTGRSWTKKDHNATMIASSDIVQAVEMLSFYSMLPPPNFRNADLFDRPINYDRHLGRNLDLTALAALRCVILIGHLERGPLPVPLTVAGQTVRSKGWTVVRWIASINGSLSPKAGF